LAAAITAIAWSAFCAPSRLPLRVDRGLGLGPAPRLDHVRRAREREMTARAHRSALCGVGLDLREDALGLVVPPLLRVTVDEPEHGVEAAIVHAQFLRGHAGIGRLHRSLVDRGRLVPHPQGEIDVRGHVQRVRCRRRDLRISVGIAKAERRMDRIVVGMNQVVRRAWVVRILRVDLFDERGGPHVDGKVASAVAGAEQRQRVERRDLIVGRILVVHALHRLGVGEIAREFLAGTVQAVERRHPVLFLRRRRFGDSALGRGRQPGQRRLRQIGCGLLPHRVVVGHRLAPVRHREIGVRLLGLLERLLRFVVLEAVHQQDALDEGGLGGSGA
jgi:hypothetical protein